MGGCFLDKQTKAKGGRRDRAASACLPARVDVRARDYAVSSRVALRGTTPRGPMGDGGFRLTCWATTGRCAVKRAAAWQKLASSGPRADGRITCSCSRAHFFLVFRANTPVSMPLKGTKRGKSSNQACANGRSGPAAPVKPRSAAPTLAYSILLQY
jgi:hypothetical protein